MDKPTEVGFHTPWRNGFHITFENGCTVSIQWKGGNYCDNRNDSIGLKNTESKACANAEIAAWNSKGDWVHPDNWDDDVKGWQTPKEVLEFMNWVASQ